MSDVSSVAPAHPSRSSRARSTASAASTAWSVLKPVLLSRGSNGCCWVSMSPIGDDRTRLTSDAMEGGREQHAGHLGDHQGGADRGLRHRHVGRHHEACGEDPGVAVAIRARPAVPGEWVPGGGSHGVGGKTRGPVLPAFSRPRRVGRSRPATRASTHRTGRARPSDLFPGVDLAGTRTHRFTSTAKRSNRAAFRPIPYRHLEGTPKRGE